MEELIQRSEALVEMAERGRSILRERRNDPDPPLAGAAGTKKKRPEKRTYVTSFYTICEAKIDG